MSIRLKILSEISKVAAEQKKPLQNLNDGLVFLDSGLDSLCFAIMVTRLEDELGFDPFTMSEDVYFPVTLGDFIRFYEHAARQIGTRALAG
jgi:acyl carrier protein